MATDLLAQTSGLANGADLNVGPSTADVGWEIHNIVATGSCDVFLESDQNVDGTFEVSHKVDEIPSGGGAIVGALYEASADGTGATEMRVRINNTSGGTIDVFASGENDA